ncbi:MAG: hypothetical protein ACLT98_17040 [Eggerthellaceae bacterium]
MAGVAGEYGQQAVVAAKLLDVRQPTFFACQLRSVTAHEARVTLVNFREDNAHEPVESVEVAGDPPARPRRAVPAILRRSYVTAVMMA